MVIWASSDSQAKLDTRSKTETELFAQRGSHGHVWPIIKIQHMGLTMISYKTADIIDINK